VAEASRGAARRAGAALGKVPRLAAKVAAPSRRSSPNGCKGRKSRIARLGKQRDPWPRATEDSASEGNAASARRLALAPDHGGVSVGYRAPVSAARPLSIVWFGLPLPGRSGGNNGGRDGATLTLAEPVRRAWHRIDPARVPRPPRHLQRTSHEAGADLVSRLLPSVADSSLLAKGLSRAPSRRIGESGQGDRHLGGGWPSLSLRTARSLIRDDRLCAQEFQQSASTAESQHVPGGLHSRAWRLGRLIPPPTNLNKTSKSCRTRLSHAFGVLTGHSTTVPLCPRWTWGRSPKFKILLQRTSPKLRFGTGWNFVASSRVESNVLGSMQEAQPKTQARRLAFCLYLSKAPQPLGGILRGC
jgi:hypothetical protein